MVTFAVDEGFGFGVSSLPCFGLGAGLRVVRVVLLRGVVAGDCVGGCVCLRGNVYWCYSQVLEGNKMSARTFVIVTMFVTVVFAGLVSGNIQGLFGLDAVWTTVFAVGMFGSFLGGLVTCLLVPNVFGPQYPETK